MQNTEKVNIKERVEKYLHTKIVLNSLEKMVNYYYNKAELLRMLIVYGMTPDEIIDSYTDWQESLRLEGE